jgi:Spy/CpxP family protein refolding chaperone
MTRKMLTLLSTSIALLLAIGTAQARPFGDADRPNGKRKGARLERLKTTLNLTDTQLQQLKAIWAEQRARCAPYRKQIRPLRQQMKTLFQADTVNEAQIVALHAKIRSLRQAMADERFQSKLKMMRLLSKEQRAKMGDGFRRGKRGRGHRGPGAF